MPHPYWPVKPRFYANVFASVQYRGRGNYVGSYDTAEEAAEAARLKRVELFTHSEMDRV